MTITLDEHLLFEDQDLIVLDKPAGIVVNRSHTTAETTVQDWVEEKLQLKAGGSNIQDKKKPDDTSGSKEYGTPEEVFKERQGIVHRLDKDTSGILLLAKNPKTLIELMRQFRDRETEKQYIALVHGKLIPSEGIIRLPMDRSETDRFKFAVQVGGRMSETEYKMKEYFPGLPKGIHQKKGSSYQGFSLVELVPKTGRTHQIRVHMSAIKHPLVGDSVYAGRKRIALDKEWCPRHFLHAKKLCFTHPSTRERLCFESPLPLDLKNVLSKIEPVS